MRILITGADGQLGSELQEALADHALIPFTQPEFELLSPEAERQIMDARPELVIHTAAHTNVEKAEEEPDMAMGVNATGTERVARATAAVGARLIYISTDYVFDGEKGTPYQESDLPNPISVYARSKLEGERLARRHCPQTLVVRTAWMYTTQRRNFVTTIMQLAAERPELRVVDDQRGCPTYARDLARVLAAVVYKDMKGVVHATGAGDCSWYEFARAIVLEMGLTTPIVPITTAEAKQLARRPAYSVLANRVLAEAGITLPHWKDALTRFIKDQGKVEIETKAH